MDQCRFLAAASFSKTFRKRGANRRRQVAREMEKCVEKPGKRLKVLSAGAVKRGVAHVAKEYERASGLHVEVEFATAPEVRRRISEGEAADVVVAPPFAMDELVKLGRIREGSRGFIGRSRMGVVVHADAPAPDLSNAEALKRVLLNAEKVVYNQASSGIYSAKLIEKLGLAEALRGRIVVVPSGAAIMEYVAGHPPAAVGLAQISEIMVMMDKGCAVKLAAPLPPEVQNETAYDAAASAASALPEAAIALARAFTTPEARAAFAKTGIG
jgi:molybdate transport system substrate-binding protein